MEAGNLLLSAGILFTGNTFSRVCDIASLINLQFFCETEYLRIRDKYLFPVINMFWEEEKNRVIFDLKQQTQNVTLCEDGRCDSPGYSAKYCTYTFMDMLTDKICDFELVHCKQTSSSVAMEKHGFKIILDRSLDEGISVDTVATDNFNQHFASIAVRVTGSLPTTVEDINKFIESLPDNSGASFSLNLVTAGQVLKENKLLKSDCSCGPNSIPVKFADHLASPLTHILNNCISNMFPAARKIARISPIRKCTEVKTNNDLRPIFILPVLSKIYERLVPVEMQNFIALKETVSAYRKGHNTTTALLGIRDDIVRAMKRSEITMAI